MTILKGYARFRIVILSIVYIVLFIIPSFACVQLFICQIFPIIVHHTSIPLGALTPRLY